MPVTNFSGGTVLSPASPFGRVGNTTTRTYCLTSEYTRNPNSQIQAKSTTIEALISFELQLRNLNYEFVSLARTPTPNPNSAEESTNHA